MAHANGKTGNGADGTGEPLDARFIFGDGDGDDAANGGTSGSDGRSSRDASSGDAVDGEQPKRKRGRPKGVGNRRKTAASEVSVSASIDGLARTLLLLHFGIANGVYAATRKQQFAQVFILNEQEARMIAEPAAALMTNYVGTRSPEAQLWVNLAMALGGVYGGKVLGGMIAGKADAPASA